MTFKSQTLSVLAVGLLIILFLFLPTACSRAPLSSAEASRIMEGEELYIQQCATCHQIHGNGYKHIYPPLAGNPIVTLTDPQPTIHMVLNGGGSMPPFRHELDVEELAQIVSYIRQAWGNNAPPVTPSQMR